MTKDSAAIRDQLGNDPETVFFLNADYDEEVGIDELSTIASTKTLGDAWIVGTATNGLVGVNTGTVGGGQQVVGGSGRIETIQRIVNPNDLFREHFTDEIFKDTGAPNTANWDTTNLRLAMSDSSDHSKAYNTTATTSQIFKNEQTVLTATLFADETKWNHNDLIKYFLSADGGENWQEFELGVEQTLLIKGEDLRVKIVFFGNGAKDTYIENLQVKYTI